MRPISRVSFRIHNIRQFATSRPQSAKNRVYTTIRTPNELSNLLLLSSSSNVPLITYWTMSWYSQSTISVSKTLIEEYRVGEAEGSVGYVEVEMDAPTIEGLDVEYGINSIPTLLAFSRGEPQFKTKITKEADIQNKDFLRSWIQKEAGRGGQGGAGGSLFDLFGKS